VSIEAADRQSRNVTPKTKCFNINMISQEISYMKFFRRQKHGVCRAQQWSIGPFQAWSEFPLRSTRRYVKRAEELMLVVTRCVFQGESHMGSKDGRLA
jgi:hypothetical protein